jgi:putative ABC transport system substrate-binding protein
LSEIGYLDARTVAIEYRWAHNEYNRLPELAADLVRRRVDVIAAPGTLAVALAARAVTTTTPIIFWGAGDAVQTGLVGSLNRPGSNATGFTTMGGELGARRLGLLRELVPEALRFAVLVNFANPSAESMIKDAQLAASAFSRQIEVLSAGSSRDIDAAFASIAQKRIDALLVSPDTLFFSRRVQLATLAVRHTIPAIYPLRDYAEVGGLMSYGTNIADLSRRVGIYTGRILKGEKPAELPVVQPTKFEFVINLQTARTLGIEVPLTLQAIADEVIE